MVRGGGENTLEKSKALAPWSLDFLKMHGEGSLLVREKSVSQRGNTDVITIMMSCYRDNMTSRRGEMSE